MKRRWHRWEDISGVGFGTRPKLCIKGLRLRERRKFRRHQRLVPARRRQRRTELPLDGVRHWMPRHGQRLASWPEASYCWIMIRARQRPAPCVESRCIHLHIGKCLAGMSARSFNQTASRSLHEWREETRRFSLLPGHFHCFPRSRMKA